MDFKVKHKKENICLMGRIEKSIPQDYHLSLHLVIANGDPGDRYSILRKILKIYSLLNVFFAVQ